MSQYKTGWLYRYKLYHLPFWFAYHFMWWTLRIGSPMDVLASLALPHAAFKFFFYMLFQAAAVYFNLYFLMPRFLEKGRYLHYIILLLTTIVTAAILIVSGYYIGAWLIDKPMQELYHIDPANYFTLFESGALPSTAASMTLAMSIKLAKNWIETRQREQSLAKEKLETELKFLRAQFNPHFLFNTINSIFVLIHKDPRMASDSLAKFSNLLRYQLYECNEQQIPIAQELSYIENFMELQKLRLDGNVQVTCTRDPVLRHELTVAPFIIMPFVENAFKHVSQKKDIENWIRIAFRFHDTQFLLDISNSTDPTQASNEAVVYRGIGLKNVQRRLDLLYAGKYELSVQEAGNQFGVVLRLNLNCDKEASKENRKVA
jgi:two-component system, LytTR family, sensor kinase